MQAAASGDHQDALAWLEALLAIGEPLPEEYVRKWDEWTARVGRRPRFPPRAAARSP